MARIKRLTTAALAIAGMLCTAAIAQAADGAQWPNIYEPQWPTIGGAADDKPVGSVRMVEPVPAPEPAPVAQRWHNFKAPPVISAFDGEFGLRYWYSWGSTKKDLYNIAGNAMVSRLSYDALRGHSAEGFGRVDHSSGFFIKGNLGAGIQTNGKLTDEDFPPFILPYSSTTHEQREGHLAYATVDLGFNLIRRPGLRIGAFAGYHYLDQEVNAYGCNQIGPNPAICAGGIPDDILVITQNNQWHSLRIGMDADIRLFDRLSLRLDAAYLPYVKLSGQDTHWLRVGNAPGDFTGPVPEDGHGRGYQLEAALSYAYSKDVSFAVGGRYWRMESEGLTHFENHVVGFKASPQPLNWSVESVGVFVQGSFKFGPYPTGGSF